MTERIETSLGDLITLFYEEYLELYGDEDLASVAAASSINELLVEAGAILDEGEAEAA